MSKIKIYRYPNGAKIIYVEDKETEFTHFNGKFMVGAADEEKGKEGVAHFLEHMAFKSTTNMSEYEKKKRMNIMCVHNNAFTNVWSIRYVFSSLNDLFEEGFKIYIDGVTNCKFDKDEVNKERKVILEEYKRNLSNPGSLAGRTSVVKSFKDREFGHSVIGSKTSIEKISVNDLKAFYQKFTPDKLTIYGGGKMKASQYKKLMEKYLGKFLFMKDFKSDSNPIGKPIEKPRFYAFNKDNSQSQVYLNMNIFNFYDKRRFALNYVDAAMNGLGGRLYVEARDKQGLLYNIGTGFMALENYGSYSLSFGCVSENVPKVLAIFKNCLKDMAQNGLEDEEFEKVKNAIKVREAKDKIKLSNKISNAYGDIRYFNRLLTEKERREGFEKVTNEDIKQVAQYLLDNQSYVIVGVGKGITKKHLESYKKA